MPTGFRVDFDTRAFMARYPLLFLDSDDELWEDWAKCVEYDRSELRTLILNPKVSIRFRARAALIKNIPHEFQRPIHWGKGKKSPYDRDIELDDWEVDEQIQRLTFDLRCSFMESLPESPAFDLSKHPMLRRIWQINLLLLEYLNPPGDDSRGPWLNPLRQRAFDCFRLQDQTPDFYLRSKPFSAFYHLMYQRDEIAGRWKRQAVKKIQPMIEQEVAGSDDYQGALAAYLHILEYRMHWDPDPDLGMGAEPIPVKLEAEMMGFLLGLEAPLEVRIPDEMLYGFRGAFIGAKRLDFLEELGRQYLLERPEDEGSRNTLSLAGAIVDLLPQSEVAQAAKEHIATAEANDGLSPKQAAARAVRMQKTQHLEDLLRRMEN